MKAIAAVALATTLAACGGNGSPLSPAQPPIDLLTYIIGPATDWPRIGTQTQDQHLTPGANEVCWSKYGDSTMFECWRWDDTYIYHAVDHALDGPNAGSSYRFTDGRWLPRYMDANSTWTLDLPDNRIEWFDRACHSTFGIFAGMPGTGIFPYTVRASLSSDTLELDYSPYAPGSQSLQPERFTFVRNLGWIRWSSQRGVTTLDNLGGPVTPIGARCN